MPSDVGPATEAHPRFTTKLVAFNEKRRQQLLSAGGAAVLPEEQIMLLEDHLHISLKRRRNPLPLFKLQMNLVQDLVLAEKAISIYKQKREEHKAKVDAGVPEKDQLEEELRLIERELHFHEAERRAIRDIADGIAWRLFDYDRAILHELASRTGSKHINLEGIAAELHEFGQVFNSREGIAVLNDLTNFLKLGDITIRKDTGTFEFVEVKSGGKKSGRITRQKQDLRHTIAFFNTGEQEREEGRVIITELDVVPETFHANIRNLIAKAELKGVAIEKIGDHLIAECTDFQKVGEYDLDAMRAIRDQASDWADNWRRKGEVVMEFWGQDRYTEIRNHSPFSIFPFPEIARVKLMTGGLWLYAYVNVSAVLGYFERKGWKIIKSLEEHIAEIGRSGIAKDTGWATVRKGPLTSQIPWLWLGQLGLEFFKPRTLVNALEAQLAAGPTEATLIFCNLKGEPKIWD